MTKLDYYLMEDKPTHRHLTFAEAIEDALALAMADDDRIIILGEDVHMLRVNLYARFGRDRVMPAPISESAFLGAAVTAAMAGLKPIVEVLLVDFLGVSMDALLNHAAKTEAFYGGTWNATLVVRVSCGGYGDGGQHEQSLWGWLAHIAGITFVVPSTPQDAGGLMLSSLNHAGPVVYFEHKLLADYWLDYRGAGGRDTVSFDVPEDGMYGPVADTWQPTPIGKAAIRREGRDISLVSVGVGVHRAMSAAEQLEQKGISVEVLDLRTVFPIDKHALLTSVTKTGRLLVVDEDYKAFGLSGELAAMLLEQGVRMEYSRVCTEETIPYGRDMEDRVLPNVERIVAAGLNMTG